MPDATPPFRLRALLPALAVLAVVLLAQLPLVLNPGYFSHDELQWAYYATRGQDVDWTAIGAFQYRPLTFNLWMWLSRHLFDQPQAFHAVLVAWGAVNAVLLQRTLVAASVARHAAAVAALVFAMSPFAVYVSGWIGTIGDLAWLSCALLAAWAAFAARSTAAAVAVALVATTIALLAKEAALSMPALAAVAWLLDPARRSRWLAVACASAAPALAYLALRLGVLADTTQQAGTAYDWSLAHVPARWLEYQLFPPETGSIEVFNTLTHASATRLAVSAALWLGVAGGLARLGWRWPVAFVLGGVAALGPVLVLGASANQYGYGLAAFCAGLVAAAWPRLGRATRIIVVAYALLMAWHGANVMRTMRAVGEVQAVYSPAMAEAVRRADAWPVRLGFAPGAAEWMFLRLSHEIPAYRGVPIGDRVRLVPAGEPADYVIQADGRLVPAAGATR